MAFYELSKSEGQLSEYCAADKLAVGELAEIRGDDRGRNGMIVLMTYDNRVVSLNEPERTWTGSCGLLVKRLSPGTVIHLKVKA